MCEGGAQHACDRPAHQHGPAHGATAPEARGLTLPQPFNLLSEVRAPRITSFLQESAMAVASNTLGQSPI